MSRVYFTATLQHKAFPGLPTLSVETNDHTGGGYAVAGLHPSSIAALLGRPPDVQPGERFDFKCNVNKAWTSVALVVFTTKHLPHLEWSSEGGMGKDFFFPKKKSKREIASGRNFLQEGGGGDFMPIYKSPYSTSRSLRLTDLLDIQNHPQDAYP